ncbi:TPA: polysaccharide lyase family 7 protein [Vibrio alginolyticus]|uniref:polysaccharide lyase family 7 protein n=1 Tax=Vibrio TaxID=662 RepID=UPI001BD33C8A|nr:MULTISPECIES: polysaccharide lyase family 7 protein [Vibrio]EHK9544927.1 polysaccharide lyase family 7 protein [Vibrio alginolyticus]EHK9602559.1 polysaccharide lyase family 7 protein [Vibrio alginolyticus]EJL6745444.1 polysaccharide lyase family 7 protein [Vibrio alginolyticus]EJL6783253.1 polysaccharide lyase family 7 protein [Vibrio alginolyticus]MBT0055919.1 polysaccharide lyase family 7 protein [Vibrio alginolyticus]
MKLNLLVAAMAVTLPTLAIASDLNNGVDYPVPADKFDMRNWKITIPSDINEDGKVDEIEGVAMLSYSHKDFFFLNEEGNLVFEVQNKAVTTKNSKNARSELREMPRGADFSIQTDDLANHWALSSHPQAAKHSRVGGTLEATLKVNHVSEHAKFPEKGPAHSVVVGQIHAKKIDAKIKEGKGYGHGNEPIKIFYKKFPEHKMGSVFWNYERNLAKEDPNRIDIAYPVWGNTWDNLEEPGQAGIALGEEFSYKIEVQGTMMNLTFETERHETVTYSIDLSKGIDSKDFEHGYAEDMFYFKAGAYGQCSVSESHSVWGTGCAGTGDFSVDKKNGDYNSVTFSKLKLNQN